MVLPKYKNLTMPQRETLYARDLYKSGGQLPTNGQAQTVYDTLGYMPHVTVGGKFGKTAPHPDDIRKVTNVSQLRDPIGDEKMGGIQSLESAVADPNYNADGRYFQGAQLRIDPRTGKPAFGAALRAPAYAGGAANEGQMDARARALLQQRSEQGKGYYDRNTGTFYGGDASNGTGTPSPAAAALMGNPLATRTAQVAGRVGPGATDDELSANRARTAALRQSRQTRTSDMLLARAQERGQQRNDRMDGVNPQTRMYANLVEGQQRGQMELARQQMGLEEAQLASQENQNNARVFAGLAAAEAEQGLAPGTLTSQLPRGRMSPGAAALMGPQVGATNAGPMGQSNKQAPFLGGKANPEQYDEVKGLIENEDYTGARDYMRNSLQLSDEEIRDAFRALAPSRFEQWERTADDPTGWNKFWNNPGAGYVQPRSM